jgi:mRNA interferase MazF
MPEQGDIVLIPVPFTDLTTQKRRPVIIVSSNEYYRRSPDVVVVAMTSRTHSDSFSFQIESSDLVTGRLNHPGTVRVDKIYTLAAAIIVKRFGKVSPVVLERIRSLMSELTSQAQQA